MRFDCFPVPKFVLTAFKFVNFVLEKRVVQLVCNIKLLYGQDGEYHEEERLTETGKEEFRNKEMLQDCDLPPSDVDEVFIYNFYLQFLLTILFTNLLITIIIHNNQRHTDHHRNHKHHNNQHHNSQHRNHHHNLFCDLVNLNCNR